MAVIQLLQVDRLYGLEAMQSGDGFNKAQSLMNIAEVSLHWLSLYLWSWPASAPTGDLVGFGSQVTACVCGQLASKSLMRQSPAAHDALEDGALRVE